MASKYDAINKIKAENPALTWTEAARQAGFSGEWTSYKGKAKPRTGDARGQARRRAKFDQPSTELAGYESKRLQQEIARVNAEAEMFGLEPAQVEHLADQEDARAIEFGSSGDTTNKRRVTQTEARFKDAVKQRVPRGYSVTLNPAAESVRVIPDKFFDPIADPSTLPGVDIKIGQNIDSVFGSFVKGGAVRFATKGLGGLIPFVGVGFDALDAKEKTERAAKTNAPLDVAQAAIANVTAATAPIPEPVSQSINFVGGTVNFVIDALRMPSKPVTDKDLEFDTL
jgi:hypothetical protein|tara:strand:- start:274 stop:1125 length:852 start_codon:yes stop_codon:yes gene_type:complete